MKDEKIPGIYCIRCLENDKLYIGESRDVYARWKQHTKDLKTNSHHNTPLQIDYNQFGPEAFEFILIQDCSYLGKNNYCHIKANLIILESYYMRYYSKNYVLYNLEDTLKLYINELPHKTNSLETDLKIKRYIVKILTNSLLKVASYKGINIINIVKQKTMYEVLKYNNLIVSCASIEKCKELINEYMYSVPEDETKDFIVRRRLEYKSIDGLHCASEYLITNEEKFNEWLKEHYNIIHDYFRKKEKELQKPIYAAPKYRSENKSKKSDGIKGIDYVSFSDLSKNIYEYYDVPDFSYSDYKKLLIQNNFIYLDENGKNVPTEDAINKGYIYEFQKTTNVIKFSRKGMSAVLDIFGKYIASISGFSQAEKILNQ